jgi:hypothetical protein
MAAGRRTWSDGDPHNASGVELVSDAPPWAAYRVAAAPILADILDISGPVANDKDSFI